MNGERARTSESHPIRVDFYDEVTLDLPGRLGMTFLPGMKDTSSGGPPWNRDLDADLRRLKEHYNISTVVSLMREEEYGGYGVPDLFEVAEKVGMNVIHFPITDMSIPRKNERDAYGELIENISGLLEEGNNVLVHCRGGLGRTGTIAASVLVAQGSGADEAIKQTKEARHGTIQTREQEGYIRRFEGWWRNRSVEKEEPTQIERYRGSLLGLAAGDALGTTLEFEIPGTFDQIEDIVGGGPWHLEPGQWTDDTSMALCLAESLIEKAGFDTVDQMERYVRWYRDGYMSSTGTCFDIGGTTSSALRHFERTGEPYAGSQNPANSAGNGSIMRLAPVPLFYARGPLGMFEDRDKPAVAMERCGESSKTTHGDQRCVDACKYLGGLIMGAVNGVSKELLLSERYSPGGYWNDHPLNEEVAEVADGSFKHKEPPEIRGKTYVIDTLEAALWAFHNSNSFAEGALMVVNLGRDADSTGAVYGQLAGAYYGEKAILEAWRSKLTMREKIEELAEGVFYRGTTVDWNGLLASMPDPEHADTYEVTLYLVTALYQYGVVFAFTWQHFDKAELLFEDDAALAQADEADIRRALTLHARQDRFSEGHFEDMVESGHIVALLRRARELTAEKRYEG